MSVNNKMAKGTVFSKFNAGDYPLSFAWDQKYFGFADLGIFT